MRANLLLFVVLFIQPFHSYAQEATGEPSFFMQMVPFILMFVIFYLLVMRPQAKKQKTHQEFLSQLKRGDRVLTSSGIYGTIEGLSEKYVTLEIADGVKVRILKAYIAQPVKEGKA